MPIRAEMKDRYPKDWYQISLRVRERAGWKCEWCGVPNGELGGRIHGGRWLKARPLGNGGRGPSGLEWPKEGDWSWCGNGETEGTANLRIVRIVLTVAHLDHQPENCADENLKALCQRCHNRYDAPMRRRGISERARAALNILDLFEQK